MAKVTKLVALKPCSFGGKKFFIGDEVPPELVIDPAAQVKFGTLASASLEEEGGNIVVPSSSLSIIVKNDGEELTLEPTDRGIQDVFNVLIGTVDNAEAIINEMEDNDALILLHLADSRKTVKAAAEARAKALAGGQ